MHTSSKQPPSSKDELGKEVDGFYDDEDEGQTQKSKPAASQKSKVVVSVSMFICFFPSLSLKSGKHDSKRKQKFVNHPNLPPLLSPQ